MSWSGLDLSLMVCGIGPGLVNPGFLTGQSYRASERASSLEVLPARTADRCLSIIHLFHDRDPSPSTPLPLHAEFAQFHTPSPTHPHRTADTPADRQHAAPATVPPTLSPLTLPLLLAPAPTQSPNPAPQSSPRDRPTTTPPPPPPPSPVLRNSSPSLSLRARPTER